MSILERRMKRLLLYMMAQAMKVEVWVDMGHRTVKSVSILERFSLWKNGEVVKEVRSEIISKYKSCVHPERPMEIDGSGTVRSRHHHSFFQIDLRIDEDMPNDGWVIRATHSPQFIEVQTLCGPEVQPARLYHGHALNKWAENYLDAALDFITQETRSVHRLQRDLECAKRNPMAEKRHLAWCSIARQLGVTSGAKEPLICIHIAQKMGWKLNALPPQPWEGHREGYVVPWAHLLEKKQDGVDFGNYPPLICHERVHDAKHYTLIDAIEYRVLARNEHGRMVLEDLHGRAFLASSKIKPKTFDILRRIVSYDVWNVRDVDTNEVWICNRLTRRWEKQGCEPSTGAI